MSDLAAVITGSAGSIGGALCRTFGAAGYKVIGLDIKENEDGNSDRWIQGDLIRFVSDADYRDALLAALRSASGSAKISVLCNNAAEQRLARTEDITVEDWQASLDVNLTAPFLLAQGLVEDLERANGSIINVASIHARLTKPEFVTYATTKSALVGLTKALAVDLGGRVRVNAICPAAIDTPMLREGFKDSGSATLSLLRSCHPAGRIGMPDEVATLALWLASPQAAFVSGACYDVDGAISSRLHDPV
jgi:NAD(P)-dependent dehydrogenase (short-subunit alcohol dehydrogenase family)